MDFELTDDQEALRDGIQSLLAGRFDIETVRSCEDRPGAVHLERWAELHEAGVFTLTVPESAGGVGLGLADAVLVFEQLGRALVPGPLVGTFLAATLPAVTVSTPDGRANATAVVEADSLDIASATGAFVEHLDGVHSLLVIASEGIRRIDPSEVDAERVRRPLDPLTPVSRLLSPSPPGALAVGTDPATARRWRQQATVLTAALQVGLASAATELATDYAKQREQFDRPIGSFQAVKHLLADMVTRYEVARSAVYAAGVTLDDPDVGDPDRAASVAKITAGEAAIDNGKSSIQVHGGMGYTWEVDAHLHLKRAWALDASFGSVDHHCAALAAMLG